MSDNCFTSIPKMLSGPPIQHSIHEAVSCPLGNGLCSILVKWCGPTGCVAGILSGSVQKSSGTDCGKRCRHVALPGFMAWASPLISWHITARARAAPKDAAFPSSWMWALTLSAMIVGFTGAFSSHLCRAHPFNRPTSPSSKLCLKLGQMLESFLMIAAMCLPSLAIRRWPRYKCLLHNLSARVFMSLFC